MCHGCLLVVNNNGITCIVLYTVLQSHIISKSQCCHVQHHTRCLISQLCSCDHECMKMHVTVCMLFMYNVDTLQCYNAWALLWRQSFMCNNIWFLYYTLHYSLKKLQLPVTLLYLYPYNKNNILYKSLSFTGQLYNLIGQLRVNKNIQFDWPIWIGAILFGYYKLLVQTWGIIDWLIW